jgi:hypothetical protein
MDEHDCQAGSVESDPSEAADVPRMLRRDLTALLRILDEQLASLSENESDRRLHIAEARSAAQRGLTISEQLIDLLRADGLN